MIRWLSLLLLLLPWLVAACTTWTPDDLRDDDDDDDSSAPADDDTAGDDDVTDDDDDVTDDDDDDVTDDDDDDTASTDDNDGDGFSPADGDCDDSDPDTHPYASEQCDGLDNDCDGTVPPDETDADGDGFMVCNGDCNDNAADANPGADEIPNDGLDNDCDGTADPTWLPVSGTQDPAGDHNGYIADLAMIEYSQVGSLLSFRVSSHTTFDDSAVMVDMYVDNGSDVYALTYDNDNPNPDALQFWSDSNGWAAPLDNPPSLFVDFDASDSIILGVDMGDVGLGSATEMGVYAGVDLGAGGAYSDEFPDAGSAVVLLGPAAVLEVNGINLVEVSGNGDAELDIGEIWHVEVLLLNSGDVSATGVQGTLNATSDITVAVDTGIYGTITPGATETHSPYYRVAVEPTAGGTEILTLDLAGAAGTWSVGVELTIGEGLETPAYESWEYTLDVAGLTLTGSIRVAVLDAAYVEQCDHVFSATYDYTYGTSQGGYWPNDADTTMEITNLVDTGTGSCPAGYHDMYNATPNELLLSTTTLLAMISCDNADGSFHGDDVVTYTGTGSQLSWCNDVGPYLEGQLGSGPAEGIVIGLTSFGGLAGLGTFTYYLSGDGNYYWAHTGMVMQDITNTTDPLYGMMGDYIVSSTWIYVI